MRPGRQQQRVFLPALLRRANHHVRIDHHNRNRKRRGVDRECSEATGIPNHFDTVMNEGEAIVQLVVAAGYDAATPGNHDRNYKYDRLAQINSVETADAAQPNAQIDALVAQLDSENTALLEQVLSQSEQSLLSEATVF